MKGRVEITTFGHDLGKPVGEFDLVVDVRKLMNPAAAAWRQVLTPEMMQVMLKSKWFGPLMKNAQETISRLLTEKPVVKVAVGCNRGQHRSVSFAYYLMEWLKWQGIESSVGHRDRGKRK